MAVRVGEHGAPAVFIISNHDGISELFAGGSAGPWLKRRLKRRLKKPRVPLSILVAVDETIDGSVTNCFIAAFYPSVNAETLAAVVAMCAILHEPARWLGLWLITLLRSRRAG